VKQILVLFLLFLGAIPGAPLLAEQPERATAKTLERIEISGDGHGFQTAESKTPFLPWGLNYGHDGRLIEDFWNDDWETVANDFDRMKQIGADVVRVHLQSGKFMTAPDAPNRTAFTNLSKLLHFAEKTGLYLDLTGLACYRPADTPAWYDALDEAGRWNAQANFWSAVADTCAASPAVFCYDLINEPIVPGEKRVAGQWRSGKLFGGYDFVQFIALDPAGRHREDIAVTWIQRMTAAIHTHDKSHLVTVGLLPWSRQWHHLSGFVPERIAPELDFISVHLYPDSKLPGEALEALQKCAVGKPIVIEETFPLSCTPAELETFLTASRKTATGWMMHFDGETPEELDVQAHAHPLSLQKAVYRDALRLFEHLGSQFPH